VKLLVVRHAKAEERSRVPSFKKKDASRRLTGTGRKQMRKVVKGLRKIAPDIDVLATSPLVRARETADILADIFGVSDISEQKWLGPNADKRALIDWLRDQAQDATVAVVGHEPHLSAIAGLLVCGKDRSLIALKKGACCLIEFEDAPAAGGGVLLWLLQPSELREIAG
jgi:phosphohistidine phosphatase